MESKETELKDSSLVCLVCGDKARGCNFEVITCMSCKAFFRRNALRKSRELQCQFDNECVITQRTRSGCSACRLKKCFALGMNPTLIRRPPRRAKAKRKTTNQTSQISLPQPTTISLLNKDRSTLTFDEWNLLSNIIQAYDEQNLIIRIENALRTQSSLPLKIRSKTSHTFDIISLFYKFISPFLERFPHFQNLPINARRMILQNNLYGTGGFNSIFVASEAKMFDYDHYITTCNEIYGVDMVNDARSFVTRRDSNGVLMKIMLAILAFSSNCSIVLPDYSFNPTATTTTDSVIVIRIQDMFIGLLWKYLVYQYGFIDAVRRLDKLVKYHLDLLKRVNEISNQQHADMMNTLVRQTTQSLTLDDSIP